MPERKFKQIIANETNLVHILDNLKEGIIAHDLERRIFFFNREAERITGYSRKEILHRDCHEAFGAPFCGERCMFLGDPVNLPDSKEYPLNIFTKDGEIRNVEMSVSALKDHSGTVFGVLAFIKDITEVINCRFRNRDLDGYANIVGRSGKMLQVFEQIHDLSGYDFPVHIYGETGTGKELVAEAIHNQSLRAGAPFVPINCGALPEGLIESELFGHVKGAFSGAIRDKKGRFEMADGGTIFLDEVAELSRGTQVKLLRFLQKGRFEKVGGEQTVSVNVRIISATNTDLKLAVKSKKFREDLYYRLNVIPIHLPPLRERKNDIPLLARYFLDQMCSTGNQKPIDISSEALSLMLDYDWPGNVRQLQNALQFAMVKASAGLILPEHLPLELAGMPDSENRRGPLKKLAPESVRKALKKTGGNKAKAARLLDVGRATLYRFLHDHPTTLPGPPEKQ